MWSLQWTETAVRDLRRLDPPVARRIVAKLEQAGERPERVFERLSGSPDYKLRVGDYRVLVVLLFPERRIIVQRVDHRSRIYERHR